MSLSVAGLAYQIDRTRWDFSRPMIKGRYLTVQDGKVEEMESVGEEKVYIDYHKGKELYVFCAEELFDTCREVALKLWRGELTPRLAAAAIMRRLSGRKYFVEGVVRSEMLLLRVR